MRAFLTRKYGPLPAWGWALVVGGIAVFFLVASRRARRDAAAEGEQFALAEGDERSLAPPLYFGQPTMPALQPMPVADPDPDTNQRIVSNPRTAPGEFARELSTTPRITAIRLRIGLLSFEIRRLGALPKLTAAQRTYLKNLQSQLSQQLALLAAEEAKQITAQPQAPAQTPLQRAATGGHAPEVTIPRGRGSVIALPYGELPTRPRH